MRRADSAGQAGSMSFKYAGEFCDALGRSCPIRPLRGEERKLQQINDVSPWKRENKALAMEAGIQGTRSVLQLYGP